MTRLRTTADPEHFSHASTLLFLPAKPFLYRFRPATRLDAAQKSGVSRLKKQTETPHICISQKSAQTTKTQNQKVLGLAVAGAELEPTTFGCAAAYFRHTKGKLDRSEYSRSVRSVACLFQAQSICFQAAHCRSRKLPECRCFPKGRTEDDPSNFLRQPCRQMYTLFERNGKSTQKSICLCIHKKL